MNPWRNYDQSAWVVIFEVYGKEITYVLLLIVVIIVLFYEELKFDEMSCSGRAKEEQLDN